MQFLLYFCDMNKLPLFFINDNLTDFDLETALSQLNQSRREEALRYRHRILQVQCAASWMLLKKAIKDYKGTVLIVSHEPEFYMDIADNIWNIEEWSTKII